MGAVNQLRQSCTRLLSGSSLRSLCPQPRSASAWRTACHWHSPVQRATSFHVYALSYWCVTCLLLHHHLCSQLLFPSSGPVSVPSLHSRLGPAFPSPFHLQATEWILYDSLGLQSFSLTCKQKSGFSFFVFCSFRKAPQSFIPQLWMRDTFIVLNTCLKLF